MSVKVKMMTIPGAPLEGLNPLPQFHSKKPVTSKTSDTFPEELKVDLGPRTRTLPYMMQDRYSRKRLPMKMKTVVLENENLIATFWPENGGRLYSLFDKVNNRELLMANPVYQPGNLAIRNAWLSGGIEFNFGSIGHHCLTCDHMFAAILKAPDGTQFLRMYEYERTKDNIYQMDFHLPKGSTVLYMHVKLFNPKNTDTTTYWWTNIAVPEDGNTRVLSSTPMAIILAGDMTYEKLPFISPFPGKDLSYPHNASRAFDYFFQEPEGTKTSWEAGVYNDGTLFFDRSTAPLLYHKMFCWGAHSAGDHWQEYLSDPKKGYYIELQGGIARSQLHDKLFPANSSIEWTECFGGMKLDRDTLHQEDYDAANAYMDAELAKNISENYLLEKDAEFAQYANIAVCEQDLVHLGSGWGALEEARVKAQGESAFPASVCFPKSTIGAQQYPWYALLMDGVLPDEAPEVIPTSWMVSKKWMALLEKSMENHGESWNALLHYGVMLNECMDEEHVATVASRWGQYEAYRAKAKAAFEKSMALQPSVWALRCLFSIANEEENDEAAESCYDQLFTMKDATVDFCFAGEYMNWLNRKKKFEKCWKLFTTLPEEIQNKERIMLCAAQAAIKVRELDFIGKVFAHGEYADIKEGEVTLTDIWFEYCALKMAKEQGITDLTDEKLDELIDIAWSECPPPAEIDFRMSFERKNKYRVG